MYKKIISLFFVLLLFVCITLPSFATFDFTYDNVEYKLPDLPLKSSDDEIVIIKSITYNSGNWYRMVAFSSNHNYYINNTGALFVDYLKGNNFYSSTIENLKVKAEWGIITDYSEREGLGTTFPLSDYEIIYTTVDLKDSSGDIIYPSTSSVNTALPHFITSDEDLCAGNFNPLRIDAR